MKLVKTMFELNRKLDSAKSAQDKIHLQRQIKSLDKNIDKLICQLYGLTDEEFKIVEELV